MMNKVFFLMLFTISNSIFAQIIGIGQVGDKYIYKINGILVSLSAGDIVAGCEVRSGSGLQCNDSYLDIKNNKSALETVEDKINKMQKLNNMHTQLQNLESINNTLSNENKKLKDIIIKRNKTINELSSVLNSRN